MSRRPRTAIWIVALAVLAPLLLAGPADAAPRGKRATKAAAWKLVSRPFRRVSEKEIGTQERRLASVRARALTHHRATVFGPLHGRLDQAQGQLSKARSGSPFAAKKNLSQARQTIDEGEALLEQQQRRPALGSAP